MIDEDTDGKKRPERPESVVKRPLNTLLGFPKKGGGYYKTAILASLFWSLFGCLYVAE